MLAPKIQNICVSVFVKYLIFYLILMISNNSFKLLHIGYVKNGIDLFYYLWIVLFFPIMDLILFSVPLFFILRLKNYLYFFLGLLLVLLAEYFIYTYFTSQKVFNQDALLKVVISFITFFLLFYKSRKLSNHSSFDNRTVHGGA